VIDDLGNVALSLFIVMALMTLRLWEIAGFMLGTTANAMANMEALVEKYGPARRAFLVVPMVGAFFIDFTNAILITAFVNFWK
jgi:ESS family glutamate:Na+ symporter